MTAVTQHKDGFGCPASFSIMSRENSQNIYLALRSIVENVPCDNEECDHPYRYFALPGSSGFRRVNGCCRVNPYKPVVMIDKFEASANACTELGLQCVLCWFHIVKALMEKFNHESVSLLNAYLIILAFKMVARSVSEEEAEERWYSFLEVIDSLDMSAALKEKIKAYFINEWWCLKWRNAWLDITRLPLTVDGGRTMTTNNCDENLNLKVANSVGGKRKKVTTLLYELTGKRAARLGNEEAVKKTEKASLLDTHAAKTICHNLGTKSSTPADILLRQNQARFLFLQNKVNTTEMPNIYLVQEDEKRIHKFKDHKGNWITVSETKVLDKMLSSLLPEDLSINDNEVAINVEKGTCTCTDYIWRSSLRDKCVHMQAVHIYLNCQREDQEHVRCREELADFLRRKQLARPRQHRDLQLYDKDTNVVLERLTELYDEHGGKLWSILSSASKSQKSDQYRPKDLPKNNHTTGRPKQRTAKPRAANPFKRKRIVRKRNEDEGVEIVKKRKTCLPSLKKNRNTARRTANRIVAKAKQTMSIASSVKIS